MREKRKNENKLRESNEWQWSTIAYVKRIIVWVLSWMSKHKTTETRTKLCILAF